MCIFWSANIFNEVSQLLAQCGQNLILILDRVYQYLRQISLCSPGNAQPELTIKERDQFFSRSLRAQS